MPDELMGCGHPASAVVSSDEGTSYCGACEAEAPSYSLEEFIGNPANPPDGGPLTDKATVGRVERRGKGYDRHGDATRPVSAGGKRGGKAPKEKPEPYVVGQEVVLKSPGTRSEFYLRVEVIDVNPRIDKVREPEIFARVTGSSDRKHAALVGHLVHFRNAHWCFEYEPARVPASSIPWFTEETT